MFLMQEKGPRQPTALSKQRDGVRSLTVFGNAADKPNHSFSQRLFAPWFVNTVNVCRSMASIGVMVVFYYSFFHPFFAKLPTVGAKAPTSLPQEPRLNATTPGRNACRIAGGNVHGESLLLPRQGHFWSRVCRSLRKGGDAVWRPFGPNCSRRQCRPTDGQRAAILSSSKVERVSR